MNSGRRRDVADAVDRIEELQPASRAHLRLALLDALYGDGESTAASAAAAELRRLGGGRATTAPTQRAVQLADLCVLAQWQLARRDTAGVQATVAALRDARSVTALPPLLGTSPLACAPLLEAGLAVETGRADARQLTERLDALALGYDTAGDASAYAPIAIARLHERLGDPQRALAALGRRSYMLGWPRYLATALRAEGRLAALVGDTATARLANARYVALRSGADAALRPQLDSVRSRLPTTAVEASVQ